MSADIDEPAPLPVELRVYVDAFAVEEQPRPGARVATWSAVKRAVERDRWIAAGWVVLVAALVVLAVALAMERG